MDIDFLDKKLGKQCNEQALLVRKQGAHRAKLLRRRLDEFAALDTLEEIRLLPQARCHELVKNRAGQLSVDLDHPYRLIFEPAHDPIPRNVDGGLDWKQVTAILIIGIEDTHE
ncbi:MAG: killer suppression protein [Acidobacteria bacterium]|nr:killer suppression protein [Acidobacteriota bacterium]